VLLCLGFLWGCFLLALHKFGPKGDAFQQFIVDHGCVGKHHAATLTEHGYIEYKCADRSDDVNLYDMPKGPGEK
jgi:hypothetical protein